MPFDDVAYALGTGRLAQAGVESGFQLAQRDAALKMQQDQQRLQAEHYVMEHDADSKFFQAFSDTLQESQPAQQPVTYPGQPIQSTQPTPTAPPPGVPAGSMGPSMEGDEAATDQGASADLAPSTPTLTPAQAARGAAAAGAPGMEDHPNPADQPVAGPPSGSMGPSPTEKPQGGNAPQGIQGPPKPQYGPLGVAQRPGRPQTFAQRLVANTGPAALAHMSPESKRMLEGVLGEGAAYMVRQERETQDIKEMIGAQVFAFYNGDAQDPQGLDNLTENLWGKVKLGLIDPQTLIKHASPQVGQALQARMEYGAQQMRTYLATDYTPGKEPALDPTAYAAVSDTGFHTLQQMTDIALQKREQYHTQAGMREEAQGAAASRAAATNQTRENIASDANQTKRDIAEGNEAGRNARQDKAIGSREDIASDKLAMERWKAMPENQPQKGKSSAERSVDELIKDNRFQQTKVGNQIRELEKPLSDAKILDAGTSDKDKKAKTSAAVLDLQGKIDHLNSVRNGLETESTDLQGRLQGEIKKPAPARTPPPASIIDRRRQANSGKATTQAKGAFQQIADKGEAGQHPDPYSVPVTDPDQQRALKMRYREAFQALVAGGNKNPSNQEIGDWLEQNAAQATAPQPQ